MGLSVPPLYAVIDRETLDARGISLMTYTEELRDAGVRLLQYRDKKNAPQKILGAARQITDLFTGTDATLILNDRADLAALLGWGVHVGQGDLSVEAARRLVGDGVVGISTHTALQVEQAARTSATYVAVGPVFATQTKADAEPVVGLEGVRQARKLTSKALVAIGGIDASSAASVWTAGADAIAVVSALLPGDGRAGTAETVAQFLRAR